MLAAALVLAACGAPQLAGTDLGRQPSPDFTLTDASDGTAVSLSSLRGKVVVLSFLYTNCPDTCPLTAAKFRTVRDALGERAKSVAFVAVSLDPARDTPEAARQFVAARGLAGDLRYLIGDRAALAQVWSRYGIFVDPQGRIVAHTDAIYLIDKQGRQRSLLHSDFDVQLLARDLRTLAAEGRVL